MAKTSSTVTISGKEVEALLRKEFNIPKDAKVYWRLEYLPPGPRDDPRDPTAQTVKEVIFQQ